MGYEYLYLLPLFYSLLFLINIIIELKINNFKLTKMFFLILSFIRLTIIPLFCIISNEYKMIDFGYYDKEAIQLALFLIVYEFIICFIFIIIIQLNTKIRITYRKNKIKLKGNVKFYLIFILVGFIILLYSTFNLNIVKFLKIDLNNNIRFGDIKNSLFVLLLQISRITIVLLLFISLNKLTIKNNKRYFIFIIIFSILNVIFIEGERRTSIIYHTIATVYLLKNTLPKYKTIITNIIIVFGIISLSSMTIYKHFYAFNYSNYLETINNSVFNLTDSAKMLQAYFWGPHNVSLLIYFNNIIDNNLSSLIFDFFRSIFGLNFYKK